MIVTAASGSTPTDAVPPPGDTRWILKGARPRNRPPDGVHRPSRSCRRTGAATVAYVLTRRVLPSAPARSRSARRPTRDALEQMFLAPHSRMRGPSPSHPIDPPMTTPVDPVVAWSSPRSSPGTRAITGLEQGAASRSMFASGSSRRRTSGPAPGARATPPLPSPPEIPPSGRGTGRDPPLPAPARPADAAASPAIPLPSTRTQRPEDGPSKRYGDWWRRYLPRRLPTVSLFHRSAPPRRRSPVLVRSGNRGSPQRVFPRRWRP